MYFRNSGSNKFKSFKRKPKQKLFKYIGSSIFLVKTDENPHSFLVSEEPVNKISP